MPRLTRSAAREQRTAALRGLLVGEDGFSPEFFVLVFEHLDLEDLNRTSSVCKFLHDSAVALEAAWEVLDNPPRRITELQQPLCATALQDGQVVVGLWNTHARGRAIDVISLSNHTRRGALRYGDEPGDCEIVDAAASDGTHLYVCDRGNRRIQKLSLPSFEFVASNETPGTAWGICWWAGPTARAGRASTSRGPATSCGAGRLFVSVKTEAGGSLLVLDAGSMAKVGEFGLGFLSSPQQVTEHGGFLYVADTRERTPLLNGCVVVFTVAGAFVRRIELQCGESTGPNVLSRPGRPVRIRPSGVAVVGGRLVVSGNKWAQPDDDVAPWELIETLCDPRTHEGEIQVLTLEGLLRQAILRPYAMHFGPVGVRVGAGGDEMLLVTDRGSFPGARHFPGAPGAAGEPRGSLFVFSTSPRSREVMRSWDAGREPLPRLAGWE